MSTANIATPQEFRYGICPGNAATYGAKDFGASTIAAIATAGLPVEQGVMFMRNPQLRRPNRATGYPYPVYEAIDNDAKGSIPSSTMSLPATLGTLDYFLASVFQKVTQGVTTHFQKVFTYPQANAKPDFSTDAGYYYGLVKENIAGGTTPDETLISAIVTKLTLSCYPDQNEGRLTVNAEWIARDMVTQIDYSGLVAPTQAMLGYYTFTDIGVLKVLDSAVTCYGFTVELTNNGHPIPTGGAGTMGTQSYALGPWDCKLSADLLLDNYVRTSCNAADFNTGKVAAYKDFQFSWGTTLTTGYLDMVGSIFCTGWSTKSGSGKEEVRTLNFDTTTAIAAPQTPTVVVTFCNDTDRGW